jgi:hypothetical protein
MTRSRPRRVPFVLWSAVTLVALAACAGPPARPDTGQQAVPTQSASGSPGGPPPGSPPAGPDPRGGPGGDQPPNAADNSAWKQRGELSVDDRKAGDEAAARITPALQRLRAAREFTLDATRQALLDLGFPADTVQVKQLGDAIYPPPGAVFAVRVGERACVIGDVRPARVLVRVAGSNPEFGCLEPKTH